MTNILKYAGVVACIGVAIVALRVYPINFNQHLAGAVGGLYAENYDPYLRYNQGYNSQLPIQTSGTFLGTGGVQIGSSGTNVGTSINTTCSLIAPSFTIAASTTVAMDYAVTGALSGDRVLGIFATSSAPYNGWEITSSSASSTAGFDTFRVYNGTGASAVIPASVASTTQVQNTR